MTQTLPPPPERTAVPRRLDHPQHWLWKVISVALILLVTVPILWAHVIAPGKVEGDGVPLLIDPHVCDEGRWLLVNERFAASGWPAVVVDRDAGRPILAVAAGVIPDGQPRAGELHGPERLDAVAITSTGERILMMRADACAVDNCVAEHMVWHLFVGDEHWGPTGYVGSAPMSRCGLKVPPYTRPAD